MANSEPKRVLAMQDEAILAVTESARKMSGTDCGASRTHAVEREDEGAMGGVPATTVWTRDLQRAAPGPLEWLWEGYLARGSVTLLTSQWKMGKTTLLAVLLARMKAGGELAGRRVRAGSAVVVSEESPARWLDRNAKLGFGDNICWMCRPFLQKPTAEQWLGLVERLGELSQLHELALVVIDPLAAFLPGRDENNAGTMLAALMPLARLTEAGLAVLVLHHPKKGQTAAGQAARGSGALGGFADILLEMHWYGRGQEGDRRRRVLAYSRFAETPKQQVIELIPEGTDYRARGDFREEEFTQSWDVLRAVLEDAGRQMTRRELRANWPQDHTAPTEVTLGRWLERGVELGLVQQAGSGRKGDPFRYWLVGRKATEEGER